jgi:uroporphyrinogen-III synthase
VGRRGAVPLTILLTRPAGRNEALAARLRAVGLTVEIEPLVEIELLETGPVDVGHYDWVVVTSATGARLLRERMRGRPRRLAAVGAGTAAAWSGPVDLVPARASQEGLLAELPRPAGSVLFAGAANARPLLAEELGADVVALYRTRERRPESVPAADLVVLASPSAARAFAALALDTPAVSIGPETTRAAQALGIRVVREAGSPGLDGLAAAVLDEAR